MTRPIYSSEEHKNIIENYIIMCKEFAKDVSTKTKYSNYLDVVNIIIDYHNGYGSGVKEDNWYTWLMIIPTNLSVATSGFFAGIETKANAASIRAYRVILNEMVHDVAEKIDNLERVYE